MAPSGAIVFGTLTLVFPHHFSWLPAILAVGLSGCATGVSPIGQIVSALVTDKLGPADASLIPAKPNPAYRYLRVEAEGRAPALLVLGYLDADPPRQVEVWYSARGEVIRTRNGRIVGTAGLEVDWRGLRHPMEPPAWSAVPAQGASYQRSRDVFPGYRYGVSEQVTLAPLSAVPAIRLPAVLPMGLASSYQWFRETVTGSMQELPPAWFAWGMHQGQATVVYSEQCLSATFCLKLLRWPLPEGAL